jgi:hypothetical protein
METDLQSLHPDTGWKEKNPHGWGVRIGRLMQRLMAKPTPARRGTRESVSCDKQAMGYVQQSIDLAISANPAIGKALHDVLLVFNRGTAQECRVKADHIVVGRFKTYVISSKYQCGRVHAIARDPRVDRLPGQRIEPYAQRTGSGQEHRSGLVQSDPPSVRVVSHRCNPW